MESHPEKYCRLYCMMTATTAYLHVKADPDRSFLCSRFPLTNTSGVGLYGKCGVMIVNFGSMHP